jgi:hypothetical protein
MPATPPLFPQRNWLRPTDAVEPMFWIREIRLLYRLEAGEDAEIRRIELHRGLNVVWARPASADESNPEMRGRGHDVGKSSFCRVIRHLLGERHYGNEQLRKGIAVTDKLQDSWVIGEIVIDGESWTVARPLYAGAHPFALKGVRLDDSFGRPASERIRHEDFVLELERRVIRSFAVQTFDDAGKQPILWLHVLQWLARDQESHLGGLFKWRDPSSQSDSPALSADEGQFLVRCILDITDVKERRIIEKRAKLTKDKGTATENIRYFERRIADAIQRAREELPGGKDLPSVGEPLFVDVITQHAQKLNDAKRRTLADELAGIDLLKAEGDLESAIGERVLAESRHGELKQLVDETADSLARFTDKQTPTTESDLDQLDSIIAKLKPDRAYCEIPVSVALFQCPLLQRARLSHEAEPQQPLTVVELAASRKEDIETQLKGLRVNLRQLASTLQDRQKNETTTRKSRDGLRQRSAELVAELGKLDPEATAWRLRAEDAELSNKKLGETRDELVEIEKTIETSKALQDDAQKEARDRQIDLEELFLALCRYLKGENADGELKFTRDEIKARIGSGGGAYNALSSITFDFAGLLAHINKIGYHPGFLLHDSPRESDMEVSLYRPLFHLIGALEKVSPNSFQYIITTTEAPPEDFAKRPHLVLELDGSKPEGHLFKLTF